MCCWSYNNNQNHIQVIDILSKGKSDNSLKNIVMCQRSVLTQILNNRLLVNELRVPQISPLY